jgi:hypothetical protein
MAATNMDAWIEALAIGCWQVMTAPDRDAKGCDPAR